MRKVRAGMVMAVVAGLLLLGSGRAQAVIGIPDDVPAATLLFPFFKVNPTPTADTRQDTLLVVTNTANPAQVLSGNATTTFAHFTIWSVNSQHIFDFTVPLTPHDVFSCSLLDLLVNPNQIANPCGLFQAPTGVPALLTMGDILAGYVTVDVVSQPTSQFPGQAGYPFLDWNVLVGHSYLVDLPSGSATGFNAVSIEAVTNPPNLLAPAVLLGQPAVADVPAAQTGFYLTRCLEEQAPGTNCEPFGPYGNRERIDGPAGDAAQTGSAVQPVGAGPDSPLSLIVRYFSLTAISGRSEVWLWKDRVTSGAAASVSLSVFDEDENVHSVTFPLPVEVNFAKTDAIITPGAPGGWFRIQFICGPFGYCAYDPLSASTGLSSTGGLRTPIQAVAYSLQFANSQDKTLRWDALFPAHRQYTTYVPNSGAE